MSTKNKIYLYYFIRGVVALVIAVIIWHLWARRPWSWQPANFITLGGAYAFALVILSSPEVFIIAFVLAMVIRGFCIEVYKIPTGSMEPTLHGDPLKGDQILANKFSRYLEPIKRFDVILFRYPLDKTKNFIKRVVGLPNEELMIKNGEIYYRPKELSSKNPKDKDKFYLAKKPLATQESIWIPIWLGPGRSDLAQTFKDYFQMPGPHEWRAGEIYLLPGSNSAGENLITYRESFRVAYKTERGTMHYYDTSDIKLAFRCQPFPNPRASSAVPNGEIKIQIKDGANTFIIHLGVVSESNTDRLAQTASFFEYIYKNESRSEPINAILKPNREYHVAVMNYDGTIYVTLDNKVILRNDYETMLQDSHRVSSDSSKGIVSFGVVNTQALFSEITLYGDIYYEARGVLKEGEPINISDKQYFVIGDNVPNSKDSRLWKMQRVYLKDGRVIECDNESYKSDEVDYVNIRRNKNENKGGDIWGNEHRIKRSEIARMEEIHYPFVLEDEIFGKALLVYWPFWRIKMIK